MSLAAHAAGIDDNKIQIEFSDGENFITKISIASLNVFFEYNTTSIISWKL